MTTRGSEPPVAGGRWIALAAGGAACLAACAFFFSSPTPWTLRGDNMVALFPMSLTAWRSWLAGVPPEWTGGLWAGFPLLSDPTSGSFYWPNFLCYALTPAPHWRAFDLSTALHAGLLVAGSVRLLQALGAAPAVAVFGGALTLLGPTQQWFASAILHSYSPLAWWPWLWLAAERLSRPGTPTLGGAMALGWLALATQGLWYPEFALYGGLVAAAWLLTRRTPLAGRRRLARSVLLCGGGLVLAAPQLVPTALHLASTGRAEPVPLDAAALVAFRGPLRSLVTGESGAGVMPQFVGAAALGLAVAGVLAARPRGLFLAGLAALGLGLALGTRTPLYGWLHELPPFDRFRSPMKLFMLTELAVAWLAALGAGALWRRGGSRAFRLAALALMAAALAERIHFDRGLLLDEARLPGGREPGFERYEQRLRESGLLAVARGAPGRPPPRVLETIGLRDLVMLHGLEQLTGGPTPLRDRRHRALLHVGAETRLRVRPGDLDLWGVHFLLTAAEGCPERAEAEGLVLLHEAADTCLFENPSRPPRYAFVRLAHSMPTWESMAGFAKLGARGPIAVLRPDAPPERRVAFAAGSLEVASYRPGDVALRVRSEGSALLLVRESYAAGWNAEIDGRESPIHPAAGVFFALPVPEGAREVRLEYRTPGLRAGAALAGTWLLGAAGAAIALRRRGRL